MAGCMVTAAARASEAAGKAAIRPSPSGFTTRPPQATTGSVSSPSWIRRRSSARSSPSRARTAVEPTTSTKRIVAVVGLAFSMERRLDELVGAHLVHWDDHVGGKTVTVSGGLDRLGARRL